MFPLALVGGLALLFVVTQRSKAAPAAATPGGAAIPITTAPLQTPSVTTINATDGTSTSALPMKVGSVLLVQPPALSINFAASPATGSVLTASPEIPQALGAVATGTLALLASQPGSANLEWTWQEAVSGAFHSGGCVVNVSA